MSRLRRARVAGHFGEFLQGRLGPDGPIALVTLPAPLWLTVQARPDRHFALHDPDRTIGRIAAHRFLRRIGAAPGRFAIRTELESGAGLGASTAARVALARVARPDLRPAEIAAACLDSEGAVDPLMWTGPDRLLWASRRARALAILPRPPALSVIGGLWGPGIGTDPGDAAFPDIADLVEAWRASPDADGAAALASESARRCLALRGPSDDPTAALARETGAAGFAIAHTGAARALLFRPDGIPSDAAARLRAAGLRRIVAFRAGGPR